MKFEYRLVKKANYEIAYNGNNGNYEMYDVFADGKKIIEDLPACDWVDMYSDEIRDFRNQNTIYYIIYNNHIYKLSFECGYIYTIVEVYKYDAGFEPVEGATKWYKNSVYKKIKANEGILGFINPKIYKAY